MVFYEGSVHIPLIMRLPGVIPAGTVVREPVSNMALFATVTDYLDVPAPAAPSTSESLRPLIEGTGGSKDRVIFSFWDSDVSPGYMVFDGRFKLMIGRQAKTDGVRCDSAMPCVDEQGFDAPGVDALYGESARFVGSCVHVGVCGFVLTTKPACRFEVRSQGSDQPPPQPIRGSATLTPPLCRKRSHRAKQQGPQPASGAGRLAQGHGLELRHSRRAAP